MPIEARREYLIAIIERYKKANRKQKSVGSLVLLIWSIPRTWVTVYSGDIGNTLILNGSSTFLLWSASTELEVFMHLGL